MSEEDPVARNRAAHPRRTPGRPQLGDDTLRTLLAVGGTLVVAATAVLVVFLAG